MKLLLLMLISENLVNAIGTTLIYSLWYGLILAAVTGVIILSTRSSKPVTRYNFLICSMLIFLVVSVATFLISLNKEVLSPSMQTQDQGLAIHSPALAANAALFTQLKSYVIDHNETIVLVWFLIIMVRCFQLIIGLNGLNHLRKHSTFAISVKWKNKIQSLTQQLGINQAIQVGECALIRVPMVIGHLKPLILLPIGLLTALPPQQIEAILIHELAHIYRRDYLVNLLQSMMEILFFFNPAVLWLSALIKAERENCCDELTIDQTSNKINYISALIACQEYQQTAPAYAMTFNRSGGLRDRVHRLVGKGNTSLNTIEKSMLMLCTVALGFGLLAFSQAPKFKTMLKDVTKSNKTAAAKLVDEVVVNQVSKKRVQRNTVSLSNPVVQNETIATCAPTPARLDTPLAPLQKLQPVQTPIGELVAQELIKDSLILKVDTQISFMLSDTELIVNGKKMPPEIYQKYKDKYVPATGRSTWKLTYNLDISTKITIS